MEKCCLLLSANNSYERATEDIQVLVGTFVFHGTQQRLVQGISIGSSAIESTVKQIGQRIKISGAQWNKCNVSQLLKHRSAYLNSQFSRLVLHN